MKKLTLCTPLVLGLLVLSCSDETKDGDGGTQEAMASRQQVAEEILKGAVIPTYNQFDLDAKALQKAADAFANDPTSQNRLAAQEAWAAAMSTWQRAELMQFGPLAAADLAMGGQDIRDSIYSWPRFSRCGIDVTTLDESYKEQTELESKSDLERGMGAIEYLLFYEASDNGCSAQAQINTSGQWTDLGASEISARRAKHAAALTNIVAAASAELNAIWTETYAEDLAAGRGIYSSSQETLNAISDALFYLDKETKDMKVGIPAEVTCDPTQTACAAGIEHPYAAFSTQAVINNIKGFQTVFRAGEEEAGFFGLMIENNGRDVAESLMSKLDEAEAAFEALPTPYIDSAASADGKAAHAVLRQATDILKSTYLSVLDLEAPNRAAGDND